MDNEATTINSPAIDTPLAALQEAVRRAGGQNSLARELGKAQGHVWGWLNKMGMAPAEQVLPIERATGVSRHDLRPDLYPVEEAQEARSGPGATGAATGRSI